MSSDSIRTRPNWKAAAAHDASSWAALPRSSRAAARSSAGGLLWLLPFWTGGPISQSRISRTPFKYTGRAAARLSSVLSLARQSDATATRSSSERSKLSHFDRVLLTAASAISFNLGVSVDRIVATSDRSGYLVDRSVTRSNAFGDSGPVNFPAATNWLNCPTSSSRLALSLNTRVGDSVPA